MFLEPSVAPSQEEDLETYHPLPFFPYHSFLKQVDKWIAFTEDKFAKKADFQVVSNAADELDRHLTLRSFLVGYKPTAADFALWGALKSESQKTVQMSPLASIVRLTQRAS